MRLELRLSPLARREPDRRKAESRMLAASGSVVTFCDAKPNSISNEDSRGAP